MNFLLASMVLLTTTDHEVARGPTATMLLGRTETAFTPKQNHGICTALPAAVLYLVVCFVSVWIQNKPAVVRIQDEDAFAVCSIHFLC